MSQGNGSQTFTAAIGQRYDNRHLVERRVSLPALELHVPPAPHNLNTGAPMPLFPMLGRNHPWDIREQAFSTYLMARDTGKTAIALPVFPSRFFPHTGLWAHRGSGIVSVQDLVGRRVACGTFGANCAVWARGALSHQYDVPIELVNWELSQDEYVPEFELPNRFHAERVPGEREPAVVLVSGETDAATLPGPPGRADPTKVMPLFQDPYPEMHTYVEENGFFPINEDLFLLTDS